MRLYDKSALLRDLLLLVLLLLRRLSRLLLHDLLRDEIRTDLPGLVARIDLNFLVVAKHWLIDLLLQHHDLRVAQLLHGREELFTADLGRLLNSIASELFALIKHTEDGGLEAVDDEHVALLCCVCGLQLDLAMRIHPSELPVRVLLLEPGIEASDTVLHGSWQTAGGFVHGWPGSTSEHFALELEAEGPV